MEQQRRLRLGDILDDYCPRERRVTNHAIVAMVEDDVKQTRCTTCDAEHVYKGGKAPRRKKSETPTALYKEVLANITDQDPPPVLAIPHEAAPVIAQIDDPVVDVLESEHEDSQNLAQPEPYAERDAMDDPADDRADEPADEDVQSDMPPTEEGPVHRQLIRAQLPRVEGVKAERQAPEFTVRHNNNMRGGQGNFRGGDMRANGRPGGNGNGGGARFGRGPQRPAGGGGRGGANHGFGRGPGGGNQPRHGGGNGPRKRGR
jgi:hypothetical protein